MEQTAHVNEIPESCSETSELEKQSRTEEMYARDNLRRKRKENQPSKENPPVMEFESFSADDDSIQLHQQQQETPFQGTKRAAADQSEEVLPAEDILFNKFVSDYAQKMLEILNSCPNQEQREATMKELMDHFHVKVMIDSIRLELDERTCVMYAVQQLMLLENEFIRCRLKRIAEVVELAKIGCCESEAKAIDAEAREKNALSRIAQLENQLEKTEGDEKLLKAKLAYWEMTHKQLKEELAHGMATSAKNAVETYKRSPEFFEEMAKILEPCFKAGFTYAVDVIKERVNPELDVSQFDKYDPTAKFPELF